jgi:hypothetical protein
MRYPKVEQIDGMHSGKKGRAWHKRSLNRKMRRFAKLNPDEAAWKRRYSGYTY